MFNLFPIPTSLQHITTFSFEETSFSITSFKADSQFQNEPNPWLPKFKATSKPSLNFLSVEWFVGSFNIDRQAAFPSLSEFNLI